MENPLSSKPGQEDKALPHFGLIRYDSRVDLYYFSQITLCNQTAVPLEFTGWKDEVMSWKKTCYIHAGLAPSSCFRVKGPDAMQFWADHCVNSFAKFPVGALKHAIMCNDEGLIITHGVLMRVGEDDFISFALVPCAPYYLAKARGKYNVTAENLSDKIFIYQLGGPKSLEILETVTGECLHDIKFGRHRLSSINGKEVRITRMGMAGSLAYEVQGNTEEAISIYDAIIKAGEEFGLRKLGWRAYQMNHTEDGFPQGFMHFPVPWEKDEEFMKFLGHPSRSMVLRGSMGTDISLRYRNPVELGWGNVIKFDHDFVGRAALEKEVANPRRKMVTLVWNKEDILDVYSSQYQPGEPYMDFDPVHIPQHLGVYNIYADQVLKHGKFVGVSSGRIYSYYYREMISLCSIDVDQGELGNEVTVLWGDPGTRQKEIRATVSRFPFLNEDRNENVDVSTIPCRASKK